MDEFKPSQDYNPEDEYEPIDTAPVESAADETGSAEPQQPVQEPIPQQAQQVQQPYYQQQAPFAPPYGQPPQGYPQQQYYAPPQQPPQGYPQQQYYAPQQPQGYPRQQYYAPRQPMQQPYPQQQVQQPVQQPQQMRQPYPQQPMQQPIQQNAVPSNPYVRPMQGAMPNPAVTPAPKKSSTSTGTKVFIIILCALLVAMAGGFIAYIATHRGSNNNDFNNDNNFFSIEDGDEDGGLGINPFGSYDSIGFTEVEDEITLKADNGETQKRSDDKAASVGTPDESAPNITLKPLPEDKTDEKYTTQSAYESVSPSVVTVVCYEDEITDNEKDILSQGTGTIISTDGYIVTNSHVISNSKHYAINIVLNSGESYQATVIGYDTWTDLAVLKISASNLKAVTFGDSELIEIGDEVIAIGSPGGVKFKNSLTKGIVSAVDRELSINKYVRYIQSDAAISPGNSGGPLCNIYGQVIGITTAKTIATNFENMSFSIPSETVEEIVGDLMRYGYVKGRARIGFTGTEISQEEVMYYGYPQGILVNEIDQNGSLAGTGIKEGDIITEIDGEAVTSFQDVYDVLANHKADDKVTVKAVRPE